MDPRRQPGRTLSPGQPLRGYQLEDRYASPAPPPGGVLEIPMGPNPAAASGDRLPLQPSVSHCAICRILATSEESLEHLRHFQSQIAM